MKLERAEVIQRLPVDYYKHEINEFGNEVWRAPEGFGFKISGQFVEEHIGSQIGEYAGEVRCSEELLRVIGEEEPDGNGPPLDEFVGTWLEVDDGVHAITIWVKEDKVRASGMWGFCQIELVPIIE